MFELGRRAGPGTWILAGFTGQELGIAPVTGFLFNRGDEQSLTAGLQIGRAHV